MKSCKFTSEVCRVGGAMNPHGIPIPDEVSKKLWDSGNRRIIVEINGYRLRRGMQGSRELGSHIVVGLELLKNAGVTLGDSVSMAIDVDPDPDDVEVCDELLIALEQDVEAKERWDRFTPGKQRGLALHVSTPKREETRIKRALDIAMKLRTRTLHGD